MAKRSKTKSGKPSQKSAPKKSAPKRSAPLTAAAVKRELKQHIIPEKAAFFPRFFKTGKGEYGEGDKFLGVIVPQQRKTAQKFKDLGLKEITKLLNDSYHECRLTGVLILVKQYEGSKKDPRRRQELCDFYVSQLDRVNNWDLVDSSAHKILGPQLFATGERKLLYKLAKSKHLWRERVSVIATMYFIKQGEFEDTLKLCEHFMGHKHDLMHKATGWMLREIGKQDVKLLEGFLDQWHDQMPRTMLRYAIEHFSKNKRARWM